jgi:anti-sigma factor RsiW
VTCQQALDLLGDFVDGDLDRRWREGLRLHLLICRHCRRYLATYRATLKAARDAHRRFDDPSLSEQVPDELVAAILKAAQAST